MNKIWRGLIVLLGVGLASLWILPSISEAQTLNDPSLSVQQVVTGLSSPTTMAFIGPNDLLVLQKNDGRVRRVTGGVLQPGEVLDVAVDNAAEHGLLGIALHPAFPGTPFVYLYYTESSTGADTAGSPTPLGNRVYRYTWDGSALLNPSLLLTLPVTPGPFHNGGVITFGPDGKLYVVIGDVGHAGQLQNQTCPGCTPPDDTGVILRFNDDGTVPGDNPFVAQGGNLAKYYAYGIRNSFGLAFDPVTGKLWMTENGPDHYDEINLVEPGFNSGWQQLMGPDDRDPQGINNLFQVPGWHYSDPKFSWFTPVAPTGMVFFNSTQLGLGYHNDAFVGDYINGNLYRFKLNAARDGFVFVNPGLADLVADDAGEFNELLLGTGFGRITDVKVGPDGLLYVLANSTGRIFVVSGTPSTGWSTYAGNPQHTAVSPAAAQPLEAIRWSTPVDLAPPSGTILIHYGSPLVSAANTVIVPVKTGSTGGYRVEARNGADGSLLWSQSTDYVLPPHNWIPSYSPVLTPSNRLYFPGAGGTVYFRDNVDSSGPASSGQLAFFGLSNYSAAPASFNSTVFINTPITSDSAGNIYFGFRTVGAAPLGLTSGIARIDANGNGTWVGAVAASGGDATITSVPHQAAPALSNDGQTVYVVLAGGSTSYLVGLNPATLALKESSPGVSMRVALKDPRNGGLNNASITDDSSASPMVGPDGDVYYGILGNPSNGSRGWMLHFSGNLTQTKTPGAFGWDNTASIVPASMVPSYTGASSYLLFTKYNNYAGIDGGTGVNKIAVLDPNDTMVEPHASSNGQLVMKEILTIAGPTPDPDFIAQFPNAVREWCINTAAVDPSTRSVMVNSEDGKLYRWDLATNTLSQAITLSSGVGEAYTPTVIGPDGTVYAINRAVLNAIGQGPPPDLVETAVSDPPATALPGMSFTVTDSVQNQGTSTAGATTTRYYLSLDMTKSVDDTLLTGTRTIAGLPPNGVSTGSVTVTIPAGTALGTYFLLVCADDLNAVAEGNESNNCRASAATVQMPPPTAEIIVDNAPVGQSGNGASFTGFWCVSSVPPPFGANSLYNCGSGVDTYKWTSTIPSVAAYDVYVWWTAHAVRSAAVPITVVHAGGTTTKNFNEQINGGQWVLHGQYTFNAGTGGYVQVTDAGVTGQISADAVRFVPASGSNPVPALTTLSPNSATAGGPAFTLTVNGSNFVVSSIVRWNGADRTTTFVNGTQVQAAITAADIAAVATIPVTVFTPAPGGGTSNALSFTITTGASQEIIVDNGTAGTSFTGTWCVSSVPPPFGANSLYNCGSGVDTYRWTPTIPAAGTFDVYVWWTAHAVRSAAAPITVVHAGGTTTKNFNEQINGGQWVLHGQYSFNAGTGGYVQVSDANVTGQISADAVRFVPTSGSNPVPALTSLSPNGATAGGPAFTLTVTGTGFVSNSVVRWNGADRTTTFGSGTQLQAAITAGDIAAVGTIPVTVFTPTPGGGTSNALPFAITTGASQEIIIDNGTAGTSFTGSWCVSSVPPPFGATSLYSCGSGVDRYRWTPTMPAAGTYDVYVWWTAHALRSAAVPITVVHAGGTTTLNVNQQINGGQWVLHGRYSFNAGTAGYVEMTEPASGQASADAVRFVPVP